MARVRGPLFSVSAAGTFAQTIVFRQKNSGSIAGRRPIYTPPPTNTQLSHLQKVAYMRQGWRALAANQKMAWKISATNHQIYSGYHWYWRQWFVQGTLPGQQPQVP